MNWFRWISTLAAVLLAGMSHAIDLSIDDKGAHATSPLQRLPLLLKTDMTS